MYQKTILVGNVGRDAEMRYTPAGVPVADFTLATNRRWTDKDGNPQERTSWFKIICWRKLAEVAAQYVRKGKLILVESDEIVASAFIGKDDEPHATLEITAASFKFLGGRRDDAENSTGETNVLEIGGDTEIPF
jgi:single-strand DNA-binding protein